MEKLFNMTEKELSTYKILQDVQEKGLKQVRAAELLGISERQFRRLLKGYREKGIEGIQSKKRGKPSNRKISGEIEEKIRKALKTKYRNCGPTFAWEKLVKVENVKVSHETVRKIMIEEGLWETKKRKRLKLYQSRMRRECKGELIQVDGSPERWFEDRADPCSLIGFIDDATSEVKYLRFVKAESTETYMKSMKEYMMKYGRPESFYTDRLSVFRINNDKEGYRKMGLTQVGRALKALGVELICANSPQAKGRIERLFKTLQDRLIKEMRLRGISSIEEGNRYVEEYIKEHNEYFSVRAHREEDKHIGIDKERLEKEMCYVEERTLTKNLELSYNSRILQVQTEEAGYALRGAKVEIRESLEGHLSIEYKGKELKYKELLVKDQQGKIRNKKEILLGSLPPMGGRVA